MEKVFERKKKLVNEKYELLNRLKQIELTLEDLQITIVNNCKHEWVTKREEGMYGERYTICKNCGVYRNY